MSVIAYIGIGSNLGDRKANCRQAVELLGRSVRVLSESSLYCTEPAGRQDQAEFINAAVMIETDLTPHALLDVCRGVEERLGRVRTIPWGPRTIDLDILLCGDVVMRSQDLTIPHPLMAERRFVLMPLAEIAPDAVHPALRRTVRELLETIADAHRVERCMPDGTLL